MRSAKSRARSAPRAALLALVGSWLAFACHGLTIAIDREGDAASGGEAADGGVGGSAGMSGSGGSAAARPSFGADAGSGGGDDAGEGRGGESGIDPVSGAGTATGGAADTSVAGAHGDAGAIGSAGASAEPLCDPRPYAAGAAECKMFGRPASSMMCSFASAEGWLGCLGTACGVHASALGDDYAYYFHHNPCCERNESLAQQRYRCSSLCPPPHPYDRVPKCEE